MYKKFKLLTTLFIFFLLLCSCDKEKDDVLKGDITTFKAELKGLNALPSNTSKAKGIAVLTYDNMTKTFAANISYNGLMPIAGHIHMAQKGESGNAIFPFREILYFPKTIDRNLLENEERGLLKKERAGVLPKPMMLFNIPLENVDIASPVNLRSNKLTEEQVEALFTGKMYVDFHTSEYPNGEIRGQLEKQ